MPTTTTADLILKIDMSDNYDSFDGFRRGRFHAYVYGYNTTARYEDSPLTTLWAYESRWARFAMSALYGHPSLSDGGAYALEWGYEPEYGLITTAQVAHASKGLKHVERGLEKLIATIGRPQSFGQEIVYLMQALGCTRACWQVDPSQHCGMHRGWRVVDTMEAVRAHIDHAIADLRERQHVTTAA